MPCRPNRDALRTNSLIDCGRNRYWRDRLNGFAKAIIDELQLSECLTDETSITCGRDELQFSEISVCTSRLTRIV